MFVKIEDPTSSEFDGGAHGSNLAPSAASVLATVGILVPVSPKGASSMIYSSMSFAAPATAAGTNF